ncbi:MAG: sulfotransferase family protein [Almyronema sp.]
MTTSNKVKVMKPVFISGCPRSGTTLLGSMLGGHQRTICTPESQFKADLMLLAGATAQENIKADVALELLEKNIRFKHWDLDINKVYLPESLPFSDLMSALVESYGHDLGKEKADIWIDHTPRNLSIGLKLTKCFPDSQFIHLVRDGRAIAASIMPLDWGPNTIVDAAYWWLENLSHGLAAESAWQSDRILRVHYEDLVALPEETLHKICGFLDIDYQPSMLDGKGIKLPKFTTQQHQLVGHRPQTQQIDSWKKKLSPRQIEIFESIAFSVLGYLGYELVYDVNAAPPTSKEIWSTKIQERYKKLVNPILFGLRLRSR